MWITIAFAIFFASGNANTIRNITDPNNANETHNIKDIKNVTNYADAVKALENKSNDLLKQINEAIDQGIDVLQKTNDSEGIAGMEYLKQLKEQLKNMVYADVETNESNKTILRRSDMSLSDHHKKMKEKKSREKYEKWLVDMAEMREKIDIWMEERNQQKEKRKRDRWEKTQQKVYEKCPKRGFEQGKKGGRVKHPCCRDCCKRSYMGCR